MDVTQVLLGVASVIAAAVFGDVAGQRAARRYAQEEGTARRLRVLEAFRVEVSRADRVARHNVESVGNVKHHEEARAFIEFRLSPFDVVFSGEIVLESSLLEAMGPFFTQAQHVNSAIRSFYQLRPQMLERERPVALSRCYRDYLKVIERYCGEWSEFLFSVASDLMGELVAGHVPRWLSQEFGSHQISLSQDARIETQGADKRWKVIDGNKGYLIVEEDQVLSVYGSGKIRQVLEGLGRHLDDEIGALRGEAAAWGVRWWAFRERFRRWRGSR